MLDRNNIVAKINTIIDDLEHNKYNILVLRYGIITVTVSNEDGHLVAVSNLVPNCNVVSRVRIEKLLDDILDVMETDYDDSLFVEYRTVKAKAWRASVHPDFWDWGQMELNT